MQKLGPRFLTAPKKAFLIKLVSFLGFGGMVGFCALGCDKPHKGGKDIVQENEDVRDMPPVYAPPPYLGDEWSDEEGDNGESTDGGPAPGAVVLPPPDLKATEPEIVQKYAMRRPNKL